jgi:hypothetical protein
LTLSVTMPNGAPRATTVLAVLQALVAQEAAVPVHALAQAPQLFTSLVVSTHWPLQNVVPVGQAAHVSYWQICAAGQAVPHVPQLASSKFGSVQPAAQAIWGEGQVVVTTQTLEVQVVPALQALPQLPQLALLLVVSTHWPLQTV